MSNPKFVFFGDIVAENGKTIRENNLAREHQFQLGAKLQIELPYGGDKNGDDAGMVVFMPGIEGTVTCYVVGHNRDCDGSPLYMISAYKETEDGVPLWDHVARIGENFNTMGRVVMLSRFHLDGPYGEEFIRQHVVEQ